MSRKKKKKQTKSNFAKKTDRNASLDSLRGIAIGIMVIDHVASIFFDTPIAPDTIRFATRLSMPLFAVLMGFFLASRQQFNWNRFAQLGLAAIAINLAFYSLYRQVEILASLFICSFLFMLIGRWFAILVLAIFIFPVDPSIHLFDFPLSIVAGCVAQGVILRWLGWRVAVATSLLTLLGLFFVEPPSSYLLYFLPIAILLVAAGVRYDKAMVPWVHTIGRYPLTAYLTQYLILLGLKYG